VYDKHVFYKHLLSVIYKFFCLVLKNYHQRLFMYNDDDNARTTYQNDNLST